MKHLYSLVIIALLQALPGTAEIKYDASFSASGISIANDTIGEKIYSHINYAGCSLSGAEGYPELPVKYVRFIVPADATNFVVSSKANSSTSVIVKNQVYPIQPEKISSSGVFPDFKEPDRAIYEVNRFFPEKDAEIVDEGFLDGDKHIITVAIYPTSYNPTTNVVRLTTSYTISLSYNLNGNNAIRPIARGTQQSAIVDYVKSIVVNSDQVDDFVSLTLTTNNAESSIPTYEYCIVTNRKLAPAFEKLVAWKRQKGYDAGIVCIEDILACQEFKDGDVLSGINDDAGKLRAYLSYSYKSGKGKYVFLGGDYTQMPIRYGNGGSTSNEFNNIPSDLYFSDLNGNWDSNQNGIYGEEADHLDFHPELYVGRLLCRNAQEVDNYTTKLILYESNPGKGDYSYLDRAFFTECDDMLSIKEADNVADRLKNYAIESLIFKELPSAFDPNPTFPTGNQCVEQMEKVRYGFFGWHGHGNPGGVGVRSGKGLDSPNGIVALQKNRCYHTQETANGLDNLTNYDYPAISYSTSCTLAPFDKLSDPVYDIEYNFAQSFTVGGLYGGPAFLGNSRYGWIGPSVKMEGYFFDAIDAGNYRVGVAEALSKQLTPSSTGTFFKIKLAHNLIGCPEFEMWTGKPSKFVRPSIKRTNTGVTISCSNNVSGTKIASIKADGKSQINVIESKPGTLMRSYTISADANEPIMMYSHNKIPFIFPLWLQNGKYSGKRYIFASSVRMGKSVDFYRSTGDFIFSDGSETTFEANDNVDIYSGTVVESGATVNIISPKKVSINGGILKKGATLNINAPEVDIKKDFDVEKGGQLNIINQ